MEQNVFAPLNTKVRRLGFGCMRFPVKDGKIDGELSRKMLEHAHDQGIRYFDTAWGYHEEESQYVVGEVLSQYPRDDYLLATKMPPWLLERPEDVDRIFNEQLKRCRVSYFDYYLLHSLSRSNVDKAEKVNTYEYLAEKKRQGVIRHLGFSFHGDLKTLEELLDNYQWDFVQLQINYFDFAFPGSNAKKEYEMVTQRGLPIVVMEPVRGGFLAHPSQKAVQIMKDFNPDVSPAEWAFRWCLDKENIPLILSGMSAMEQLQENLETFKNAAPLTVEESEMLDQVTEEILSVDTVPCTACRYCMDCSFGVDIPALFGIYNSYQLTQNKEPGAKEYRVLREQQKDFDSCTKCEDCIPLCPQNIQIPYELDRIRETVENLLK